jgi:hypothetical protein
MVHRQIREIRSEWYDFPFEKPTPSDPTRAITTLKMAWTTGRFHDKLHTLMTELAESGAGDQTIIGYCRSRLEPNAQALQTHSHGSEAEGSRIYCQKQTDTGSSGQQTGQAEGSLQKSLHSLQNGVSQLTSNHAPAQPDNSAATKKEQQCSELPVNTQHLEGESLRKSLQSCNF